MDASFVTLASIASISSDAAYPVIVAEAEAAMSLVMPASRPSARRHPRHRYVEVNSYAKHWPCLFPQHGPGMKHQRRIALEKWQRQICDRYPHRLLRGLIHSDGCRSLNTIRHPHKSYGYPATSSPTAPTTSGRSSASTAIGSTSSGAG